MPKIFGGGGTTNAGDLTTGQVALARGGTNADLSATGGTGHVLKQSSAGANITVGAIAAGDLPTAIDAAKIANGNVSNTEFQCLDGVTSAIQTQLDGKLNDTGDTITGALSFSGSISSAGSTVRNIHGNGGTTDLYANVPTGGNFTISENGSNNIRASANGLVFAGANSIASSSPSIGRRNTSDIFFNVPTGYVLDCNVNAVSQVTIGTYGLQFPTAHSSPPSTSVYGVWRGATGIALQSAADGRSALFANSFNVPTFSVYGPSHSTNPGQITGIAGGVSLAAGATRAVGSTGLSGTVLVVNLTDHKRATFSVENGTPTKIEGDATIIAGAPGASQIGLELSSTTLRVNNGYASAKLITTIALLAY